MRKRLIFWLAVGEVYVAVGLWFLLADVPYGLFRWRREWTLVSLPSMLPGLVALVGGQGTVALELWSRRVHHGTARYTKLHGIFLIVPLIVVLGCFFCPLQSMWALSIQDVEVLFFVTDMETNEPIDGATFDWQAELRSDELKASGLPTQAKFATDKSGAAKFVMKGLMCDEHIRPFRKTYTEISLLGFGGNFTVSAAGYESASWPSWETRAYDDMGYFSKDGVRRIKANLALVKSR